MTYTGIIVVVVRLNWSYCGGGGTGSIVVVSQSRIDGEEAIVIIQFRGGLPVADTVIVIVIPDNVVVLVLRCVLPREHNNIVVVLC